MTSVARIAVEKTTCRFDKLFDYELLAEIIDYNIADKANINSFWRP